MTYTYALNESLAGGIKSKIEADHYELRDGYFTFLTGWGSDVEAVFSIDQKQVTTITRHEHEE